MVEETSSIISSGLTLDFFPAFFPPFFAIFAALSFFPTETPKNAAY